MIDLDVDEAFTRLVLGTRTFFDGLLSVDVGIFYVANRISQLHGLVKETRLKDDISHLNLRLSEKLSDSELRCYVELTRIAKSSAR